MKCIYGFGKNFKGKMYRGDNKCRLESVGAMWNCSQKGEPATWDGQEKYNISKENIDNTII